MTKFDPENSVLLFYEDFDRDRLIPGDRHLVRQARTLKNLLSSGQKTTGFRVWFELLESCLRQAGCNVLINSTAIARRYPRHPIGLCGYPHVLKIRRKLPNAAILGPGLFDHPSQCPNLFSDSRYRLYLATCSWMEPILRRAYGAHIVPWFAGLNVGRWPDTKRHPKIFDILIYDKIRFDRELVTQKLLLPIQGYLSSKKISFTSITYGKYDKKKYLDLLSKSKSMIFLCEHETQGMAYQEALACNVPVLAWDAGVWADPHFHAIEGCAPPASSVPYFAPDCGERFKNFEEFPGIFSLFWERLEAYAPRRFIETEMSPLRSAHLYLKYYRSLIDGREA